MASRPSIVPFQQVWNPKELGLGTETVCTTGSSNLIDLASIFASGFCRTYAQEKHHIILREPPKCVSRGESREERQYTAAILYTDDLDDGMFATD